MSPEGAVLTTNSSVQASPEQMLRLDEEQCVPNFQLPDPILSRQPSSSSLAQPATSTQNTTTELSATNNSKGKLLRSFSSRASRRISTRRRTSSVAPASRDGSVGPCFLRRRSDSNATAPPEFPLVISTDSESDVDDKDEIRSLRSALAHDGPMRESSANSTTGSINGSSTTTMAGPVIPEQVRLGMRMRKISRKNKSKRVCLAYDRPLNRLTWGEVRATGDAKPTKYMHVDEIREIRTGADIQQYGRDYNIPEHERAYWICIIYCVPEKSSKLKLLHLIPDTRHSFETWTQFLDATLQHRQEMMTSLMSFNAQAITHYWHCEMERQHKGQPHSQDQEEMDISGVKQICQNLHIYSSQIILETQFRLSDSRNCERLNFREFMDFVRRMKQRQEVQQVLRRFAARPELGLTLNEFLTFLQLEQGEDVEAGRLNWERIFTRIHRKYRPEDSDGTEVSQAEPHYLSEAAFVGYLSSAQNRHLLEEPQEVTLDRPMNEYFISSSHNTYLLGRQVAGKSSVEGYISALTGGCRCVEIDCWDGPEGQPIVLHGRALTSSISFKETLAVINKYAFAGHTRMPIWISLEVHCNPTQQLVMVQMIKETFGRRLILQPLDSEAAKLPSPSQLMERVIIKVKSSRMREELANAEPIGRRRGNSFNGQPLTKSIVPENAAFSPSQSVPPSPMMSPSQSARRFGGRASRVDTISEAETPAGLINGSSDNDSGSETSSVVKSTAKTIKELADLGVYCAGVKFGGFDSPEAKRFNHIFSFKETSFANHSKTKEEKMALDIHNMRYLMRVYPDGTRVSSSNFDPLMYWRRGVQMAAMNWQTFDLGMQINRAMFEGGSDSSGYVLKPPQLRDIRVLPYNSDIAQGKKERSVVSFSIDVISAQQLMRPSGLAASKSMDPYVEVEVFHANDKRDKKELDSHSSIQPDSALKFQTEIVRENAFNPIFNEGRFKFRVTTKHPDLIFVRWSVKLSNDGESYSNANRPPVASYMAKLKNLKQGYRHVPLHNHAGEQYLFSTLFCKINVDPIEKTLVEAPRSIAEPSKLNRLGSKVFGRTNSSPRSTLEKGAAEIAFDY